MFSLLGHGRCYLAKNVQTLSLFSTQKASLSLSPASSWADGQGQTEVPPSENAERRGGRRGRKKEKGKWGREGRRPFLFPQRNIHYTFKGMQRGLLSLPPPSPFVLGRETMPQREFRVPWAPPFFFLSSPCSINKGKGGGGLTFVVAVVAKNNGPLRCHWEGGGKSLLRDRREGFCVMYYDEGTFNALYSTLYHT